MIGKKGEFIDDMRVWVLLLTIIAFLFGVGLFVLASFTHQVLDTETGAIYNETLTGVNESGKQVARAGDEGFTLLSVISVYNATNATGVLAFGEANYTFTGNGTIWYSGGVEDYTVNDSDWNISYTYSRWIGNKATAGLQNVSDASNSLAGWMPIIIIVLAASIVIFLVLRWFGGIRKPE